MKILLDENIPHKLRARLPQHEVATVSFCGWSGLKNGELMKAAADAGLDMFITGDQELEYQQNLEGHGLAVLVLSAHHWPIIKNHIPEIVTAMERADRGSLLRVNCGTFARQKGRPR